MLCDMNGILKSLIGLAAMVQVALGLLIASILGMVLILVFSMVFEMLTGVDLMRDHIRPFFQGFL